MNFVSQPRLKSQASGYTGQVRRQGQRPDFSGTIEFTKRIQQEPLFPRPGIDGVGGNLVNRNSQSRGFGEDRLQGVGLGLGFDPAVQDAAHLGGMSAHARGEVADLQPSALQCQTQLGHIDVRVHDLILFLW
jgi:hypothetical protein